MMNCPKPFKHHKNTPFYGRMNTAVIKKGGSLFDRIISTSYFISKLYRETEILSTVLCAKGDKCRECFVPAVTTWVTLARRLHIKAYCLSSPRSAFA